MTNSNIMKKIKLKKILLNKNKTIINLFYVENDFYYSIIYHPKEHWWEPINNPSSLKPIRQSSMKKKEPGVIFFPRTSLKAYREMNKIALDKENNYIKDNELINLSELKIYNRG